MIVNILALLPLASLFARALSADVGLDQSGITYRGSGCPAGSLTAEFSQIVGGEERSKIALSFSVKQDLKVSVSSTSRLRTANQTCNISLPITMRRGYIALPASASYFGYVKLDAGATAIASVSHSWAAVKDWGDVQFGSFDSQIQAAGPLDEILSRSTKADDRVVSPCAVTVAHLVVDIVWEVTAPAGKSGEFRWNWKKSAAQTLATPWSEIVLEWDRCLT